MKTALAVLLLTSGTLVALPTSHARAADENPSVSVTVATAPEAHEPQLIDIDGTIFVQLGLFLAVLWILNRFLWRPYLRVRTERVARVEGYREEAQQLEVDAQQRLARADAALAEARRVGAGERQVARQEAQAREQTLLAEANAASQRKLAEARARLNATVEAERKKLEADSSQVAVTAARKILGREVST
jgi:F-type H+-transporting ATPase subunit b